MLTQNSSFKTKCKGKMGSVKFRPIREVSFERRRKLLSTLEESRKEVKVIMNKELQLKLKDNLIITSLDGEGLVLDLDTRKIFWINETATFLLRLFETNHEGVSLFCVRSLLQEYCLINDRSKMMQDLTSFINYLDWHGLVSLQPASNGTKIKNPDGDITEKPYLKPIIEEEIGVLSITGATVRAARMAASAAAAVSRAVASGFRGFK